VIRAVAALAALALLACTGSDGGGEASAPTATTATTPAASTASTSYDPLSAEGQVEVAYLRSWDDYAAAAFDLDPAGLVDSYADAALDTVRAEIDRRSREARPAAVAVQHSYTITLDSATQATVFDEYVSHQVDLDGRTRTSIEPDPAVTIRELYTLRLVDRRWRVVAIERLR
jgi:hypothetical protein